MAGGTLLSKLQNQLQTPTVELPTLKFGFWNFIRSWCRPSNAVQIVDIMPCAEGYPESKRNSLIRSLESWCIFQTETTASKVGLKV